MSEPQTDQDLAEHASRSWWSLQKLRAAAQEALGWSLDPSYRDGRIDLAFTDRDFLLREELRPVRLQLELLKPQMVLDERGIRSTVVVMGSARVRADGTGAGLAPGDRTARLEASPGRAPARQRRVGRRAQWRGGQPRLSSTPSCFDRHGHCCQAATTRGFFRFSR